MEKSGLRRTLSRTVSTRTPGNTPPISTATERSEFALGLLSFSYNGVPIAEDLICIQFFTPLHGMQTRSSDQNSVRLSVCLSV